MTDHARSTLLRYGAAGLAVLLATAARLALDPFLGDLFPFATLFFAVLFVAGYGGRGPALLATGLGAIVSARFLLPPRVGFIVRGVENQAGLLLYLVVGVGIALLGGALREARKRARADADEAARQREQLRITLSGIGDAVLVTDDRGRIVSLNPVAETLTGWPTAQAAGLSLGEVFVIVNERTRQAVESPVERVLREGTVVGLANHTVLIARDGTKCSIDDSAAPIRDALGRLVGVVLVFRDVRERRRAEEAHRRLAAIVESSDDAIVVKDLRGTITTWNAGADRVYGYPAAEVLGKPFSMLVPLDRTDEVREVARRLRSGERLDHFETVRQRKDGTRIDVSVSYSPVKDDEDQLIGTAVITRDITPRKQAEERLRRSEQDLADFFENATVGLHWVGPDGTILRANRAELDMLGYEREEYVGRNIAEFHADRDVIGGILHCLKVGEKLRDRPARMRCKDGSIKDVLIDSSVLWEGERFVHTRCFTRDVTDRKRAEEAARAWERHLQLVTDSAPVFLAHCDTRRRYKFVNKPYAARFGLHPRDIIGRTISEVLGDEAFAALAPHLDAALSGRRVEFEVEVPYRDIGTKVMSCAYEPEFDGAGRVVGYVGAILDVTEPKKVERALREAEARFAAVVNHAPACIFAKDRQGRYLLANRSLAELVGRRPEEFPGRTDYDFFPQEVADEFGRDDDAIIESGQPRTYEESFPQDGVTRTYLTVKFPLRNERGDAYAACAVATEITDLKRVQEALRSTADRLNLALAAARLGDWGWDAATDLVTLSERAASIFGIPPGPHMTWTAMQGLLHEGDRDWARRQVEEAVAGRSRYEIEYRVMRADGMQVWVAASGRAQYSPSGQPLGMFGVVEDISARKEAERAIRESEERFRGLMEQAPFSIQVLSPDGRTLRVNRAWEELWDVTLDRIEGYNILHDPQLEAKGVLPLIRRAFEGEAVRIPAFEYDPNKTIPDVTLHEDPRRWASGVIYPLKDADGRVREVVVVHEDMTARIRAESALRESEERFRAAVDQAAVGVALVGPDNRTLFVNRGLCEMLGYSEHELLACSFADVTHPDDLHIDYARMPRLVSGEAVSCRYEKRYRRRDGSVVWADLSVAAVRDERGELRYVVGVVVDITERKKAHEAVRESEERLRLALEAGRMGTWDWDLRTGDLAWSDNLEQVHGLPPGGFDGTMEGFRRLVHPLDRERVEAEIGRAIEETSDYEVEFRIVRPDGSMGWMSGQGRVFRDEIGPVRMIGIGTDIDERKKTEEALREADRRKDEFLATLAHELRNPLAPIRNALHVMKRGDRDIEQDRAMAERQVVHLTRLIDDLMDVARISQGKIELKKQAVDLATVVHQAVEAARPQIEDRRHRLVITLPDEPVRVDADPTRLEQILWNLLNNAAKYTETGGRISLEAVREGDEIAMRVWDTGIGIPSEMLPRIFDLFVQVDGQADRSQGGLGIGLGLVRTLVEMHGGTVTASSEGPGRGSEFVVRLPILPLAPEDRTASGRSEERVVDEATSWPRRRILVVDDNADAALSLARLLEVLYDQDVRVAHDGPEALAVAEQFRPEVVLLDIGMAGMDGHEVARRLRAQPEFDGTVLVALTGWGQESDRRKSKEAGFDLHLVKPVDPEVILELLAGLRSGLG